MLQKAQTRDVASFCDATKAGVATVRAGCGSVRSRPRQTPAWNEDEGGETDVAQRERNAAGRRVLSWDAVGGRDATCDGRSAVRWWRSSAAPQRCKQ